jgi:hypothetical protein
MRKHLVVLTGMIALLHLGCSDAAGPGDQSNGRITITNNAGVLGSRVTYLNDSVPIDSAHVGYPSAPSPFASAPIARSPAASMTSYQLMLRAQVASPTVNGQVLQATSVSIVGTLAIVSYTMAGPQYLGAVDVIDISNNLHPTLVSEATFQNTDVNAVTVSGSTVYVGEATGDTGFASPAVFETMQLQGSNLVLSGNRRRALSSYVATSTAASGAGTKAYATTGDAGGLFGLNLTTLATTDSIPLHDARWVAVGEGKLVVVQGTPGKIAVYNESTMSPVGTFSFPGADIAQSKSQAVILGGKAFIAAGDSGVEVLSDSTGKIVGAVPRPNPDSLGLSASVVVTNAVAVDQDLMFISNGEAGVYLAQGSQFFSATGSEASQTITMRGKLRFANLQSVNHVAYQNKYLIVAAGLGGLKIVQVL